MGTVCVLLILGFTSVIILPVNSQTIDLVCPSGWSRYGGGCYHVVTEKAPWDVANVTCHRNGGKLVEPAPYDLNQYIGNLATAANLNSYWIGYNRLGFVPTLVTDLDGQWSDRRQERAYFGHWGANNPNVQAGECVYVQLIDGAYQWQFTECSDEMSYICQLAPCPQDKFRCVLTGSCLPQTVLCNGGDDCGDGTDEANCVSQCNFIVRDQTVDIESSNYPNPYNHGQSCQWILVGPIGSRIELRFLSFNTEEDADVVEIRVGGQSLSTSSRLALLSGDNVDISKTFISSNNLMIVRFQTDASISTFGFSAKWSTSFLCGMVKLSGMGPFSYTYSNMQVVSLNAQQDINYCETLCINQGCAMFSYEATRRRCTLFGQPIKPVPDQTFDMYVNRCPNQRGNQPVATLPNSGGNLIAVSARRQLSSPLYPLQIPGDLFVTYIIEAEFEFVITIELLDADVGPLDSLTVYDGDTTSASLLARFTSTSARQTIVSTSARILVHIRTQTVTEGRGFLLSYRQGCNFVLTETSGTITSPGYGRVMYPSRTTCVWQVTNQLSLPLKLMFQTPFDMETNSDHVQVFVGTTFTSGNARHTGEGFTGQATPTDSISTQPGQKGQFLIRMMTSAIGTGVGFSLRYSTDCPQINASANNIQISPTGQASFGVDIVIQCRQNHVFTDPRYRIQSRVTVSCQFGGTWNISPIPECYALFCGKVAAISNGYVLSTTGVYAGNTVMYQCLPGYSMVGIATSTCLREGTWTTPPRCQAIPCNALPVITNGRYIVVYGSGTGYGTVVQYSCDPGFEVVGVSRLVCGQNQSWSNLPPVCQRRLCTIRPIQNGVTLNSGSLYTSGDLVRVQCNPGYRIRGVNPYRCAIDDYPTCEDINECTDQTSTCQQLCRNLPGSYECYCGPGYRTDPNDSNNCLNINECFEGYCGQGCTDSPGGYTCLCRAGYELYRFYAQRGLLSVGEDGTRIWHKYSINHTCILVPCPSRNLNVQNGRALTSQVSFVYGDKIEYLCNMGYAIQGTATSRCLSTGNWDFPAPTCQAITCPPVTLPANNPPTPSTTNPVSYRATVSYTCILPGGVPLVKSRRCLYYKDSNSYQLLGDDLNCPEVACGPPTQISGSLPYSITSTIYPSQFNFACRNPLWVIGGQSSQGDIIIRCGADGKWDYGSLRCDGPTCSDPGRPLDGVQVATTYEEYSIVSFRCLRPGFMPEPSSPLICQYNPTGGTSMMSWNGTVPTCVDVTVPEFSNCPTQTVYTRVHTPPSFTKPTVRDNSGAITSLTTSPTNYNPDIPVANDMEVVYIAEDDAGNRASCVVQVKLVDEKPPQINGPTSVKVDITSATSEVNIDPSNLGWTVSGETEPTTLVYNPPFLNLTRADIGRIYYIEATAEDSFGNTASSRIQVSVAGTKCQPWSLVIRNGVAQCLRKTGIPSGYVCDVKCNAGYGFYENINVDDLRMECNDGDDWNREEPECVALHYPTYLMDFHLRYSKPITLESLDCGNVYSQLLDNNVQLLTNSLTRDVCNSVIPSVTVSSGGLNVSVENVTGGEVVLVKISLEIKPKGYDNQPYTTCASYLYRVFNQMDTRYLSAITPLNSFRQGGCPPIQAAFDGLLYNNFECHGHEEFRELQAYPRTHCLECPLGYYSEKRQLCVPCKRNTYRDTLGSDYCPACPQGSRSTIEGAKSVDECSRTCPEGMISPTGTAPCTECPYNTYSYNTTYCASCPPSTFTRGPGKGQLSDCIRRCDAGSYSNDGLQPCSLCIKNSYQDKVRQIKCIACPDTQHTVGNGSVTPASCTNAYQRLCLNPNPCGRGRCFVAYFDYYCTNCPQGVTGPTCNEAINYCESSPCHNGGSCIVTITGFRCRCPPGTTGNLCETQYDECVGHQCQNGGMCQDAINGYNCLCPSYSPYSGQRCLTIRDPCTETPCSNGNCVSYGNIRRKCECSTGYTGEDCSINIDECALSPCLNGGTCIDDINSFRCSCVGGYGGRFCVERDNVCATAVCGVNGLCVDNYINSVTQCVCSFNFQDVNGVCNLIDECVNSPCMNSGTCSNYRGGFNCDCPIGFEGVLCQHNIDDCEPGPCQHDGICVDKVNSYECLCTKADTGGPVCADTKNNCDPYPCALPNGPSCTDLYNDYQCNCDTGWTGKNCTERTEDACAKSPCQHNSTCLNTGATSYSCSCNTGWTGTDCETSIDACNNNLCDNGGVCINTVTAYYCECPSNYRGDLCKTQYDVCTVANHCVGPGSQCRVVNGLANCTCPQGWSGDGCETKNVICAPTICQNGGTCNEIGTSYSCSCVPGYTGSRCEVEIDECSVNTCPTGHICVDQFNSYKCVCPRGKYGQTCNKDIPYGADLVFTPGETIPGKLVDSGDPILLNSTGLTVSFWVRYTGNGRLTPGTVLTLYGLDTPDVTGPKTELLTVEGNKSSVSFAGGSSVLETTPYNLADGLWHHVALTWDGSSGAVRLIIDKALATTLSPYGQGRKLPQYGYLVLGGKYDPATNSLLPDGQFEGRLSHVEVIPKALVFPGEVSNVADQVPPTTGDSLVGFTDGVITDPDATLDYQSELAQNICRAGLPCPSNLNDFPLVSVNSCDENQVIVSPNRIGSLTWTPPVFDNSFNVTSTHTTGDQFIWGTYYVTYVASGTNGAAAICTVRIAYRRYSCLQTEPTGTVGGRIVCEDIPSGRSCSAFCTEYKSDQSLPSAQLYSCNEYSMWGAEERQVPFQVPACAKSDDRLVNALVRVVYSFGRDCNSITPQLQDRLRAVFTQVNSDWQSGLCNSANCGVIPVYVNCTGLYMETTFNAINDPLKSTAVTSLLRSPEDILAAEFVDNSKLNFESSLGATPDIRTLEVILVPYCVPGSQLIKDTTCVNCAAGTFYNNDTARCQACEKGQYQSLSVQFSCISCPSGQTTAQTGAQSSGECHESCAPGDYFDLSEDICKECQFGSYQPFAGYFYCIPCAVDKSTLTTKSVSVEQCVDNGVVFETTTLFTGTFETPSIGGSTDNNGLTDGYIVAIVIGIILLLLLLLLLLLCCCCRERLAACCPCLGGTRVRPEHDDKWRYISRYGESNDKHVNYRLSELRGKPTGGLPATRWTFQEDKASLMRDIASEGSQTPPQVANAAAPVATGPPILPPLDMSESPRRRKKKTRKHKKHHRSHEVTRTTHLAVTETSGSAPVSLPPGHLTGTETSVKGPVALPPIPSNELGNPMMTTFAYCFEKTDSGRFQTRPNTEISNVQYSDFVTEKQTSTPRSIPMRNGEKIMVDSDEEDYR